MDAPRSSVDGPVVAGFDGSPSGEDGLALAGPVLAFSVRRWSWRPCIRLRRRSAPGGSTPNGQRRGTTRRRRSSMPPGTCSRTIQSVEYRVVASSSAAHGLHDIAEELGRR